MEKIYIKKLLLGLLAVSLILNVALFYIAGFKNKKDITFLKTKIKKAEATIKKIKEDSKSVPIKAEYFDDVEGECLDNIFIPSDDSRYCERTAPKPVTTPLYFDFTIYKVTPISLKDLDEMYRTAENDWGEKKGASKDDIDDWINSDKSYAHSNYLEYGSRIGNCFSRFFASVLNYKTFDVDRDGIKEEIIEARGFGASYGPSDGYIIKNNKIILRLPLNGGSIESAKGGNGFYIRHQIIGPNDCQCGPSSYRLIRVVYENKEFEPVWEQKVKYLNLDRKCPEGMKNTKGYSE